MLPEHFREICEGYENKVLRELHTARKTAFISLLPHADKGFSFSGFCKDFWPLPGDNEASTELDSKVSMEEYNRILQSANKQISDGRRKRAGVSNKGKR